MTKLPEKVGIGQASVPRLDVHSSPYLPAGTFAPKITHKSRTITIPKPEWWNAPYHEENERRVFRQAFEACSKASGITFVLEDNN